MKLSARQKLALMGAFTAMSVASTSAMAAGFQLYEESAAGTGDYHAGYAAEADDASTEFYNPAGMVRLKHTEASAGAVLIPLDANFKGTVTQMLGTPPTPFGSAATDWVSGSTTNFIPNIHLVMPFKERWAVGFGVTVPFGLATNYPAGGTSSYGATVTRLEAINFNPNIAFAVTDKFSLAAGVDVVYGTASYDQNVALMSPFSPPPYTNWLFTNSLSDTAVGWNAGLLYQFTPKTRIGLSYRSHVNLNASGPSHLEGPFGVNTSTTVNAQLDLPGYATLSVFSGVTPKWDLMGSAMWTNWNRFNTLTLNDTALSGLVPLVPTIPTDVVVHENYHNSWNFAVGAHYRINDRLMLKMGGGYDLTPTRDGYRDMRLPDANRIAVALGMQAALTKTMKADLGWIHLFGNDVDVDSTLSGAPDVETGTARFSANVIGLQLSAQLDKLV